MVTPFTLQLLRHFPCDAHDSLAGAVGIPHSALGTIQSTFRPAEMENGNGLLSGIFCFSYPQFYIFVSRGCCRFIIAEVTKLSLVAWCDSGGVTELIDYYLMFTQYHK